MISRSRVGAAASAALVLAAVAAAPSLASPAPEYVPGEVVVTYRDGATHHERVDVRREAGIRSLAAVTPNVQRAKAVDGDDTGKTVAELEADPRVRHAVPNYIAHASASVAHASASAFFPNDPGKGGPGDWAKLQWNFAGPFGVGVLGAWENAIKSGNPGGRGVVVAVLDTGVAYRTSGNRRYLTDPDLNRKQFVRGHDFLRRRSYPYDRNGHGTHVTGTIAQWTDNGVGVAGIAYHARIMPVRVLDAFGEGEAATIARAIRFATRRGAKIINMSFEFDIGITASQIPDVVSAIRYAHRRGVAVVAAAGNTADNRVAYPARARQAIAVGAITEHGCLADYSNTGDGVDLVAPGGGADAEIDGDGNCQPFAQSGRDVFQYTYNGSSPRRFGLPSGYEGTSMAGPHVVGTAALLIGSGLLGKDPDPDTVQDRLEQRARNLGEPGYDTTYGWGLLDAAAATAP